MKYIYVTAMLQSLQSGIELDLVLARTQALLANRGHQKLWPHILRALEHELVLQKKSSTPTVCMVRAGAVASSVITDALTKLNLPTTYREVYDDTLIGGFVILHRDMVYDASYKQQLLTLYENITAPATTA